MTTTAELAPDRIVQAVGVPPTAHRRYFAFLGFVLLGYALAGRGFAYLGLPPVFIGEIALVVGVVLLGTVNRWRELLGSPSTWPLLALFVWGGLQTAPYLRVYGIDCLRDAVGWGYGIFAIVVAAMILDHGMLLEMVVALYTRFFKLFLSGIPVTFVIYRSMGAAMPHWPWADIKILQIKEGDAMVHLSGILAFWVSGLAGQIGWGWTALLTVDAVVLGVIDRAGMIAFLVVFCICMAYRPGHGLTARVIAILATVGVALFVSNLHIPVPDGKGRDISFHQIIINLGSVTGDSGSDGLDSTKEWRLDWWRTIRGYTFFGKYFWTGKGFGVNLADEDGFQMLSDHSLRNPHSVHMTMLARGGVPMLAFWLTSVGTWYWLMGRNLLRARHQRQPFWEGIFFFLPAYVLAFLINGSFDVFIEGPMGGIWLWTLYGIGLGAALLRHRQPARGQTS